MTSWLPVLAKSSDPAYIQIAEQMALAIRDGRLRAGDRLPTHRLMADLLGLNVSTVTRAYREAERRGLIGGEVGRGTFVLGCALESRLFSFADRPQQALIDLSTNTPPTFPDDLAFGQTLSELLESGVASRLIDYPSPADMQQHRLAALQWLVLRGIEASPSRVVLCAGAQHAMEAALAAVATDTVGCESLCWPGLKAIARSRQLRLVPLALDSEGIRPDALERAARHGLRALVCMPTMHNPTTLSWSAARRAEIVALARAHDLVLIEEDVYGALDMRPAQPLAALAPERVCHVTGLSKTVAPGLRLGYLVLPPQLAARREALEHHTQWYVSPLSAEIARRWLSNGLAVDRLRRQRAELQARWKIAQTVLRGHDPQGAMVSPHLWLPLATPEHASRVADRARQAAVAVVPSPTFAVSHGAGPAGLRVSLGAAASRSRMREGLSRLLSVLA
ncbi:PLP-dependent aminotransferase family protein [Niveibacterium sp. 24ML]|uniref:aminotransferase-like domain-containing protein n=1 Tax=Niveibacterium sp. 24ML TaxID=2985512 RepID=UPI00226D958E|nr:PLP-dependent aminotransferase family protein [Niveibacterium sp. 24ML]MCX9157199.1 PLP-dependent aminotransferase family protein [Niveibacterium sp. 24ML]